MKKLNLILTAMILALAGSGCARWLGRVESSTWQLDPQASPPAGFLSH